MAFYIEKTNALKFIEECKAKKKSFDAIITDPPYNISRANNFKTIGRNGISFGKWDFNFNQTKWVKEAAELLKKGGNFIIFNDYKNIGEICKALKESGCEIKDFLRWIKKNPMPRNVDRRYVTDFEFAIWAVKKGGKWTFNKPETKKYLRPEFKYSIVNNGKNKIHPTQKNVNLLKEIIKIHTNEYDVIFDPFMGSGSTGIAALQLSRNFVGVEISKKYFLKAKCWLEKTQQKLMLNKKDFLRSPLYYLGDKYKLLNQIFKFFPKEINNFFDPFSGGGTLFSNINAKKYFFNDIGVGVSEIFEIIYKTDTFDLIEKVKQIIRKYNLSLPEDKMSRKGEDIKRINKKGYEKLRSDFNKLQKWNIKKTILLLVLVFYGFNSQIRFNSKNKFNIPVGKQDLNNGRLKLLEAFSKTIRNKNIEISKKDFEEFILKSNIQKKDFVYLDPPYLVSEATYNSMWNKHEEKRLLNVLDELSKRKIKWAFSNVFKSNGKTNHQLIEWAKKYNVYELDFNYKNSNYQRKNAGEEKEVLITNYEN